VNILLVAATIPEIEPLLIEHGWQVGMGFPYSTRIYNYDLDIVVTGAGINHTAFHLGQALSRRPYQMAIQAGIAGSFSIKFPIGTVVRVASDQFSDFGSIDHDAFLPAHQIGLLPDVPPLMMDGILYAKNISAFAERWPAVKGITVQTVHGNQSGINEVVHRLQPDIESMEGAAFFYACHQTGIDCIQLRSISNFVEPRNRGNWNIPLAVQQLHTALLELLKSIS
jgi:futalosine hydrolase